VECGGLRLIRSDSSAVLCMEAMRMDQVPEWMYFWSGEFSETEIGDPAAKQGWMPGGFLERR